MTAGKIHTLTRNKRFVDGFRGLQVQSPTPTGYLPGPGVIFTRGPGESTGMNGNVNLEKINYVSPKISPCLEMHNSK